MSHLSRQSTNSSNPGETGGEKENVSSASKSDVNTFIGTDELLKQFNNQLEQFIEWDKKRDWLAFHHHHYDWWMFPIDEISSRGTTYQLTEDVINDLKNNTKFISDLRQGVKLMVRSWGWDIKKEQLFPERDDKQKWSYWPVRLYKAGKCMWLFGQNDYYQSLKKLAYYIKDVEKEKLDYFSHTVNGKADVIEQWTKMEKKKSV